MLSSRSIAKNKRIYHLVKSDRINALRKQYDAFLEEDKKRKERNDFILGRLDKMRYSTALVPLRHKPSAFEIRPAIVDRPGFQPEFASVRDFQPTFTNQRQQLSPDIQIKNNEETYLFQEISKKYILIPKLRTTFMNNTIKNETTHQNLERFQEIVLDQDTAPIKELKPNSNDNTDWKSKYEILNILKNEEKEKSTENDQTDFVNLKQSVWKDSFLGNNKHHFDNYLNTVHDETPVKHVNEYPEKDLTADTLRYEIPQDSKTVHETGDLVAHTDTSENNNIFVANVEQMNAIGNQLQNISLEYKHSDEPNIDDSREVTNYREPQPEPDVNIISTIADVCTKQSEENINIQDEYPVEAVSLIHGQNEYPVEAVPLIHGQNVYDEQHELADSEQVVYADGYDMSPTQVLNYDSPSTLGVNDGISEHENLAEESNDPRNEEFTPNVAVQMKEDVIHIPQDQTYLNSNIETVDQTEPVIEQTGSQGNITESIDDFDAEQKGMFYSEQTDSNYPTQHGDEEHPLDYSQDQFPQNQEYAYYENTAAEGYPAALNDEEVTQQYDPSYDQQYTGLDQGAEREQYGEQYQEPERFTDQVEPQYDELQYEQQFESQQEIEQKLDVEDGYTAQKAEAPGVAIPPGGEPIETDKSEKNTSFNQ